MKKRAVILALVLTICGTSGLFGLGIGPQIDFAGRRAYGVNIGVTFKLDKTPMLFGVYSGFGYGWFAVGFTADYWFLNDKIADVGNGNTVNWFIGLGAWVEVDFYRSGYTSSGSYAYYNFGEFGIRMPIGINFFVSKKFEPYFQLAPSIGLGIRDSRVWNTSSYRSPVYFAWQIPLSFGCRFWI